MKPDHNEIAREIHHLAQSVAQMGEVAKSILYLAKAVETLSQAKPKPRVTFGFAVGVPIAKERHNMPLQLKVSNEQKVNVKIVPVTDTGKPAKLDGSPAWSVISGNSQVVVADDGLSADLVSADDPGDTEILVKADADLGEGVEEISDTIQFSVIGATAKNLGLVASPPVPK